MQYVTIFRPTNRPFSYDDKIILIFSIYVHKSADNFTYLVIFDTHGRLVEYLESTVKLGQSFDH